LPGKIFKDIIGKPMLWHMINRLKYANYINEIIIAIPDSKENDELESYCSNLNINIFRGDENDVLSRYYFAALKFKADIVVRVTSDCPLIDPSLVDEAIKHHLVTGNDYTSKGTMGGLPRGFGSEIINFKALEKAYNEAKLTYQREHVTPYLYQHPELFNIDVIQAEGKLKRPDLRFTVDTPEDLD
jgi:spore coat polysaccharide biosynthesis protein SpsF (cytidylyltransferase family)